MDFEEARRQRLEEYRRWYAAEHYGERLREKTRRMSDVLREVRAANPGKSPQEIGGLVEAELHARGLVKRAGSRPAPPGGRTRFTILGRWMRPRLYRVMAQDYHTLTSDARDDVVNYPRRNSLHLPAEELASMLADWLAKMTGSDEAAAELLGVPVEQMATHREQAAAVHENLALTYWAAQHTSGEVGKRKWRRSTSGRRSRRWLPW